jgi:phosphate uptake regulator
MWYRMIMETRKIMSLGKYSLVVSLPKEWLKMSSLDKGDDVTMLIQRDLSLIIHPGVGTSNNQKEIILPIDPDTTEESIIRSIIGCYLNGYNTIKLKTRHIFSVEQNRAIRSVTTSLYLRIIESTASQIILQSLMDESMASVVSGIERMHIITSSMCQDVLNAITNWNEALAKSVLSLEGDVDQFMYFLLRLIRCAAIYPSLASQLGLDMVDCLDYQTLVHRIERIADHLTNIANRIINLCKRELDITDDIHNVLINAGELAFSAYERAVEAFLSGNLEDIDEIINTQYKIEDVEELIRPLPYLGEREDKLTCSNIFSIRDSLNRISEHAADIAELAIDRKYKG